LDGSGTLRRLDLTVNSKGMSRFGLHIISIKFEDNTILSRCSSGLRFAEEIVKKSRKMMRFILVVSALVAVAAEKDSAYYPDGMENPNLDDKMYWADAMNVLEDISEFDALYITHHGCV
jgi:hypothetical protein